MSHQNKRDYYEVLKIDKNASQADIKKAFRKLAMKYHPDRAQDKETAEAKFKEINEAYMVLSDPDKRSKYDRFGFSGPDMGSEFSGGGFSGFGDIFDMFFGGGGGGGGDPFGFGGGRSNGRRRQRQGSDVEISVTIDFLEAVFGVKKTVSYTRDEPCDKCDGTGGEGVKTCSECKGSGQVMKTQRTILGMMQQVGTCPTCRGEGQIIKKKCPVCKGNKARPKTEKTSIDIPGGVDNNMALRVQGHGNIPSQDSIPGDLIVVIRVRPDHRFKRDGNDIHSEVQISFADAIMGCKKPVETVEGVKNITIKPGVEPDTYMRMKGKGIPRLNSRTGRGDHIVRIKIHIPKFKDLNPKQQKAIKDYIGAN